MNGIVVMEAAVDSVIHTCRTWYHPLPLMNGTRHGRTASGIALIVSSLITTLAMVTKSGTMSPAVVLPYMNMKDTVQRDVGGAEKWNRNIEEMTVIECHVVDSGKLNMTQDVDQIVQQLVITWIDTTVVIVMLQKWTLHVLRHLDVVEISRLCHRWLRGIERLTGSIATSAAIDMTESQNVTLTSHHHVMIVKTATEIEAAELRRGIETETGVTGTEAVIGVIEIGATGIGRATEIEALNVTERETEIVIENTIVVVWIARK
jgi:hypothetical protein